MKLHLRVLPLLALLNFGSAILLQAEEKKVEFQGKVSAVDSAAGSLTVRTQNKDYVFAIEPERCKVVKDGYYPAVPGSQPPSLESAKVGDAVVGTLVLVLGKATVTELFLTSAPETGLRVAEKHGHIVSPYHSPDQPNDQRNPERSRDVRGYRSGSFLVDKETGKIFRVP